MSAYRHIFFLTRPLNLLIVVFTMAVVRYIVMQESMDSSSIGMKFQLSTFDFVVLIAVVLALTAAGNIINDYFDQKVDKINKPEQVIVGKKVKRRVAIVLHQGLNIFAIVATLYVCIRTNYWLPLALPAVIATILWWYSPVLKKKVFVGNLAVAFCTACVPLWAALFEMHELQKNYSDMLMNGESFFTQLWLRIAVVSLFAFVLTLLREAVKDMEDLAGDMLGEYRTIPIVYGLDKTKNYLYILIGFFLAGIAIVLWKMHSIFELCVIIGLLLLPTIVMIRSISKAANQQDFHRTSQWIKVLSVLGIVSVILLLS